MRDLKKNEPLIIAGSAPCVLEDIAASLLLLHASRTPLHAGRFMIIGCKSPAETTLPHIDYHVSHENDFAATKAVRAAAGLNTDYLTFSNNPWPGVDVVLSQLTPPTCSRKCSPRLASLNSDNLHYYSGSSSLLGLKVALMQGYKKIIIAGVPLDEGRYAYFQKGWIWILPLLQCLPVRATSGFTREIFGAPTEDWING